jgi:hypothetical protein
MLTHPSKLESHPSIAKLAGVVRAELKIRYEQIPSGWSSQIKGSTLRIGYSDSPHPVSCLAHELLHAKIQLNGYRRIKISFTGHGNPANFSRMVDALDNELQHHRMFPSYQELGLPPEQFYDHQETGVTAELRRRVFSSPPRDFISMIPDLLTVLALGGELTPVSRSALLSEFKLWAGPSNQGALLEVEAAMDAWSKLPPSDLNAEATIGRICRTMHHPCFMWFGYSVTDRPPRNGFFAGPQFEVSN